MRRREKRRARDRDERRREATKKRHLYSVKEGRWRAGQALADGL